MYIIFLYKRIFDQLVEDYLNSGGQNHLKALVIRLLFLNFYQWFLDEGYIEYRSHLFGRCW